MDQLPDNISSTEAYRYLVHFLSEDYRPLVKKVEEFDTTYTIAGGQPTDSEQPNALQEKRKQVNIVVLVDASGSMAGHVDGQRKMEIAKHAVSRFAQALPEQVNVSLRVYGHLGSNQRKDKEVSCKSTEEIYPLSKYNQNKFEKSLNQLKPVGYTPIALAIQKAQKDLSKYNASQNENIVYIVSDGIETCGGDPVGAAKQLHESNIKAIVNIIGFDVDNAGQQALKQVAVAGGGEFETANSAEELRRYLDAQNTKMELKWRIWDTEARSKLQGTLIEKETAVRKLVGLAASEFDQKVKLENQRMVDALNYLEEKKKINFENRQTVDSYLIWRKKELEKYSDSKYHSLNKILRDNYQELEKRIKEMKNKGLEEYQ
ncbi:vWA domain-containing protein [Thermoactinomyces mirandus]|uniref:vWA domain-containing protein n=1 Tax=Thermoactinomyces mirandus TaxID=2756294 RepID=UPI0015EF371D|nr:VWA domain-containing protein [Thermoactinomyces mirandus]